MLEQQLQIYRVIFYDFLKNCLEKTPRFLAWYEKLTEQQLNLINQCHREFQDNIPYWGYIAYLENMKINTREQVFAFVEQRPLLKTSLERLIDKLFYILEDWRIYRTNGFEKRVDDQFEEISLAPKVYSSITRNPQQCNEMPLSMPSVKRYFDLTGLINELPMDPLDVASDMPAIKP